LEDFGMKIPESLGEQVLEGVEMGVGNDGDGKEKRQAVKRRQTTEPSRSPTDRPNGRLPSS
jgi:hypothetical protein